MSSFAVNVVRVDDVQHHDNADRLAHRFGRVILKEVTEEYLLRKGNVTELT